MKQPSSTITNAPNSGNTASLAVDPRIVKREFTSNKGNDYVTQKDKYYSLSEKPFENVQKETKTELVNNFQPYQNIIVLKSG